MSIDENLSKALDALNKKKEVFVETDLVNAGAQDEWSTAVYKQALKKARSLLGGSYTKGHLLRYGPVVWKGKQDYVRLAGQVLYAGPEGPPTVETPNGKFRSLHKNTDPLLRPGRPSYELLSRDDFVPWSEQKVRPSSHTDGSSGFLVDGRPLEREIERVSAELRRAQKRITELESADPSGIPVIKSTEDILEFFEDFDARIKRLEEADNRLRQALVPEMITLGTDGDKAG